jgi:uncharacterized protein (TIGR02284 family)
MPNANDKALDHLNNLVEINKDAEAGFLNAAKNIKNSELETQLGDYAKQHAKFGAELQAEITRLGGSATNDGTAGGALHRGWMDLKAALTGHSAGAILSSCESGEDSALAAYDSAEADLSTGQTFSLLQKQREQITAFRTRLNRLIGEIKDGVEFPQNE